MAQEVNNGQMNIVRQTTSGMNGGFIKLGDIVICFGLDNVALAGTTINLPYTYPSAPWMVQATTRDTNEQNAWCSSYGSGSSIVLKQKYATTSLPVGWMTIGPA